jgi:hypothetical protein
MPSAGRPIVDGDTMTTAPLPMTLPVVPEFSPAPVAMRAAAAVLSLGVMLAACGAGFFAARAQPEALWAVAGLQGLVVLGGVFGLVWSRGCFAAGPVLGLLCAAGSVLVGGMLSFVAHRGVLGPLDMKLWVAAEVLVAVSLAVIALWSAVERDRASRVPAIKGVLLAMPSLALLVVATLGGRLGIAASLAAIPTWARLGGTLFAGFVAAVMLCMAAHHLAEAFGRAAKAGRASA